MTSPTPEVVEKVDRILACATRVDKGLRHDVAQALTAALEALGYSRLVEERDALREALVGLEPYLDAIVCYASTMDEHEPNRLVVKARAALQPTQASEGET